MRKNLQKLAINCKSTTKLLQKCAKLWGGGNVCKPKKIAQLGKFALTASPASPYLCISVLCLCLGCLRKAANCIKLVENTGGSLCQAGLATS